MKILCDVCNKKEACVFCSADEAALCDVCDQRVHHANKLASKHERYSLLQPSSHSTLCDICQEQRALLFCQQDRAILCRDCDISIHTANEHTQKHNRFLLTGIKLSQMISNATNTSQKDYIVIGNNNNNNNNNNNDANNNSNIRDDLVPIFNPITTNEPVSDFSEKIPNLATATHVTNNNTISSTNNQVINGGSTSKISDYLVDMLPGWRFEDLLDSASLPPLGFYKSGNNHDFGEVKEDDVMSFYDVETQFDNSWVPQAGPIIAAGITNEVFGHHHSLDSTYYNCTSGLFHGTKQHQQQETSVMKFNNTKYLNDDDFFTVPEITASVGSKRNRSYW